MENIDQQQSLQQQQQIQKIINESPRKKCSCGSEHFDTATVQVEVSSLLSGTGKNEILLVGVLVCRKCGAEVQKPLITA
jgi:hypothetical protein